jgi:hypothetical protein
MNRLITAMTQIASTTTEKPAKGVKGFLLYSPFTKKYFFRVYDPEDKKIFVDYDITAEDIEIELLSNFNSLYEGERNRLDYSSKVLGNK